MANFNVEDYIKDMELTAELEEKARKCKTERELMELAADNNIELPDEALEAVAATTALRAARMTGISSETTECAKSANKKNANRYRTNACLCITYTQSNTAQ